MRGSSVVVIVEPKSLTIKARPEQAVVLTDAQLPPWLRRFRPVLAWEELARVSAVAVLPGTWHKRPGAQNDPQVLQQKFDALRHLVVQARRRRAAWVLGIRGVVFLALMNGAHLGAAVLQGLAGR